MQHFNTSDHVRQTVLLTLVIDPKKLALLAHLFLLLRLKALLHVNDYSVFGDHPAVFTDRTAARLLMLIGVIHSCNAELAYLCLSLLLFLCKSEACALETRHETSHFRRIHSPKERVEFLEDHSNDA